MKRGLLLINLGTPNSTKLLDIVRYLCEFLTDPRVIDLPILLRYLLVYGFIVPFRCRKTAKAYRAIWTEQGSPLLFHHQDLVKTLQKTLGSEYQIALGMRYGTPPIATALDELKHCVSITVLPLYPQYSSATTGSSLEKIAKSLTKQEVIPSLYLIRDFYQHPAYLAAQAQLIRKHLQEDTHLVFSYHGLPERQIQKSGCQNLCPGSCNPLSNKNPGCYKSQCHQTSFLLTTQLQLDPKLVHTAFQSRLGTLPWIQPYIPTLLADLATQGVKNLAIVCPSFVTDCLETLEEIGMRTKALWLQLGGKQFTLIPCLNAEASWIQKLIARLD